MSQPSQPSQGEVVVPKGCAKRVKQLEHGVEDLQHTCATLGGSLHQKADHTAVPTLGEVEALRRDGHALCEKVVALEKELVAMKSSMASLEFFIERKADAEGLLSELRALGDSTATRFQVMAEVMATKAEAHQVPSKAEAADLAKTVQSLNEAMKDRGEEYRKALECKADLNSVPSNKDFAELQQAVRLKADIESFATCEQLEISCAQVRQESESALLTMHSQIAGLSEKLQQKADIQAVQNKADLDAVPTKEHVKELVDMMRLKANASDVPTKEQWQSIDEKLDGKANSTATASLVQVQEVRNTLQQRIDARSELLKEELKASNTVVHGILQALCDSSAARLRAVDEALATKAEVSMVLSREEAVSLESMLEWSEAFKKALDCKADVSTVPSAKDFAEFKEEIALNANSASAATCEDLEALRAELETCLLPVCVKVADFTEKLDHKADAVAVPTKANVQDLAMSMEQLQQKVDACGHKLKEQIKASSAEGREELQAFCASTATRLKAIDEAVAAKAEKGETADLAARLQCLSDALRDWDDVCKRGFAALNQEVAQKANIASTVTCDQLKALNIAMDVKLASKIGCLEEDLQGALSDASESKKNQESLVERVAECFKRVEDTTTASAAELPRLQAEAEKMRAVMTVDWKLDIADAVKDFAYLHKQVADIERAVDSFFVRAMPRSQHQNTLQHTAARGSTHHQLTAPRSAHKTPTTTPHTTTSPTLNDAGVRTSPNSRKRLAPPREADGGSLRDAVPRWKDALSHLGLLKRSRTAQSPRQSAHLPGPVLQTPLPQRAIPRGSR